MKIDITVDREYKKSVSVLWLRSLARQILVAQCAEAGSEMGIYITGQEKMRELNRVYRGKDKTTDVLSFSFYVKEAAGSAETDVEFPIPEEGALHLGELVISLPQAELQAAELGHPVKSELARLLIHGIMHLLGFDHEIDSDAEIMEAREEEIMKLLEPSLS